jgi:AbrB family looped-hinge helix DNA binding protein
MSQSHEPAEIRVGPQGRLVIPAPLRRTLGIDPGDTLVIRLEDNRLVLEKRETILARLRDRFRRVPPEVSLADELIRERREEVRREAER